MYIFFYKLMMPFDRAWSPESISTHNVYVRCLSLITTAKTNHSKCHIKKLKNVYRVIVALEKLNIFVFYL